MSRRRHTDLAAACAVGFLCILLQSGDPADPTASLIRSGTMNRENAPRSFTAAVCAALAVFGALGALYLPILLG
jgi:hypothetical protein